MLSAIVSKISKFERPIATITNLAYFITGVSLAPVAPLSAISTFFIGISSGLYHATKKRHWRHADRISIYLAFTSYPLEASSLPFGAVLMLTLAITTALYLLGLEFEDIMSTTKVTGALFLANLVALGNTSYSIEVLGIFAIAFTFWTLGKVLNRYDFFHGMWHVIAAWGIYKLVILLNGYVGLII